MRQRNQRFPQSSCIGLMMKLRSACGLRCSACLLSPPRRSKRHCQTCSAPHALCFGRGIFPGQALRRASLRGESSRLCLRVPHDCPKARGNVESCRAAHALASVLPCPPRSCRSVPDRSFYSRTSPRLRLSSAPPFADKKRQLVAELPWHSLMRRKIEQ